MCVLVQPSLCVCRLALLLGCDSPVSCMVLYHGITGGALLLLLLALCV
jgi:hypothetical protein